MKNRMNKKLLEEILTGALGESVQVVAKFDRDEMEMADMGIEEQEIPILPLRNMMLFPQTLLPVNVNRESALKLLSDAEKKKQTIAVMGQKQEDTEHPEQKDLYRTGVLGRVVKILKLPDGSRTAFLQGLSRVQLVEAHMGNHYLMGHVERFPEELPGKDDREFHATTEACKDLADKFMLRGDGMHIESSFTLNDLQSRIFFVNFICGSLPISNKEHIMLLEETQMKERAKKLLSILGREAQFAQLKANIQMQTQADLSRGQREFFLRKEMENIKDELGENDEDEIVHLRERAQHKKWSKDVQQRFDKELKRLEHQSSQSPDYSIQLEYLNQLLDLPWDEQTHDRLDIAAAERILNRDHYGMESVKERILEYLAVLKLRGDLKSPIICLYGPPGVGKTSLGRSIAKAMKRKYVRVSLGGVQDEAEIRGHRRTYIGAMPGRIIKGLQEAGASNPVFILDEIDKVGQNAVHGDPASALLEVLDPEQNKAFHDNYIDMDYDVSNVLFIATANNISTIPAPLLDRMELIEVSGYLTEEKIEIARRHLIPKQLENVGMKRTDLKFSKAAIEKIIEDYTRESGVRELDKKINKILRRRALNMLKEGTAETTAPGTSLQPRDVTAYLGTELFSREKDENTDNVGVVTGLAWTAVGGEILFVETSLSKGKGEKLTLTGNLGDVMKESAMLAMEYVKAHAEELDIKPEMFEEWHVHIHVPEGAVPKDGPSAGITIATSIASAFTQRKVRRHLAMTGEITLRGKVMPVGGIKEKILAAKRAGITDIVLCLENEKNIKDIPEIYVKGLTFHYVERVEEVLNYALL
ncbi:MAG: endopeptidase La [Bacteroidaceae bacterium]|nr:endopeptidase La [Bacteroidaceae bacterium]